MHIYVIGTQEKQKIGYSGNVEKRLSTLQTGNAEKIQIHYTIEVSPDMARKIEKKIHNDYRYLMIRGEWFNMKPEQATSILEHAKIRWSEDTLL
jgi:hypothetical protein